MALTYRTTGAWGAGKGGNLLPAEVDANFYELAQQIVALGAGPAPAEIDTITLVGTQLTFTLSDARVFGPFTIPRAAFRWRGEWAGATAYAENDVVSVDGAGVFLVLIAHTSASTFDAGATSGGLPVYQLMLAAASGGGGATARTVVEVYDGTFQADTAEAFHVVYVNNGVTITIPHNNVTEHPIGTKLEFVRSGAGTITIQKGAGSSFYLNWPDGVAVDAYGTVTMAANFGAVVTMVKVDTNLWHGWGDLTLST